MARRLRVRPHVGENCGDRSREVETCLRTSAGVRALPASAPERASLLLRHLASHPVSPARTGLASYAHLATSRRAVDQRSSPEGLVDGSCGPLLGRGIRCVDTQRQLRLGVPQVLGEGADPLAGVEQHAAVAVLQCMPFSRVGSMPAAVNAASTPLALTSLRCRAVLSLVESIRSSLRSDPSASCQGSCTPMPDQACRPPSRRTPPSR